MGKYWNKKLKCWWDYPYVGQEGKKIYQYFRWKGELWRMDITECIEVRGSSKSTIKQGGSNEQRT